jgi:siderophore synthetase component
MNGKPLAGTQPLEITTWQKVNSRLLAKSIAELMHEEVAQPAIISTDEDGRTHFLLSTDRWSFIIHSPVLNAGSTTGILK